MLALNDAIRSPLPILGSREEGPPFDGINLAISTAAKPAH
jgi:hypothetical protein